MPGPAVKVSVTETPQSAGTSQSTGTAFVVAEASYGPEVATLVRSLGEAVALYGPRSEAKTQKLYDQLDTEFTLGAARAYVNRVLGSGSAAAKLELETTGTAKTLVVTAKYKGSFGNSIKIEIFEETSKTKIKILNSEGEVLEESPLFSTAKEMLEWGEKHTTYVTISEGSGYGAGKAELVKKISATKLASGENPTPTKAETIKAVEGFAANLGPGTLSVPVATYGVEESVHLAMAEHSQKFNRLAACDLKHAEEANSTVANLTGEKGTYAAALSSYMIFTASSAIVQGVTLGTTRTVPGSAVVSALRARVSATGNDNQAPCGQDFSLAPFVSGFTNPFKQPEIEELSTAGINSFNTVNGTPCLYGFVTALSKEKDLIFWQASASAERMALAYKAGLIGNTYLFKTIDGRKRLIYRFQGDLQGMVKEQWEANALFGETAPEAGAVNVGEPINTLTTIQNGELNAELLVRISPYANLVSIIVTSTPVT